MSVSPPLLAAYVEHLFLFAFARTRGKKHFAFTEPRTKLGAELPIFRARRAIELEIAATVTWDAPGPCSRSASARVCAAIPAISASVCAVKAANRA